MIVYLSTTPVIEKIMTSSQIPALPLLFTNRRHLQKIKKLKTRNG